MANRKGAARTPVYSAQNDDPEKSENSATAAPKQMTASEMGKIGGARVRDKMTAIDPDYYRKLGKKGGNVTAERHGPDHYSEMGRKGGQALRKNVDDDYYKQIGKKGGDTTRRLVKEAKQKRDE